MIFDWGKRTYVMGILNVTPDSFSGDGLLTQNDWISVAVAQAMRFVNEGADIIDIGAESSRPGSTPIAAQEEMDRLLPAIEALKKNIEIPISVDTYRAGVAEAVLDLGADWINDIWGLRMDRKLASVAAKYNCPIVLMHNRSKPKDVDQEKRLGGRYVGVHYDDLIEDVISELEYSINIALNAGIDPSHIIIDPGIGFGKTVEQNLRLIDELGKLKKLGYPLLLGPSRKSFIGYTLDLPPEDRFEGTAAAVAIGIDRGADIVRVHDVKQIVRIARMTDKIVRQ